jgi:hypothetical protein
MKWINDEASDFPSVLWENSKFMAAARSLVRSIAKATVRVVARSITKAMHRKKIYCNS